MKTNDLDCFAFIDYNSRVNKMIKSERNYSYVSEGQGIKVFLSLSIFLALFSFVLPSILFAQSASSKDASYLALNNSAEILQPANWYITEKNITSLDDSKLDILVLMDQSEKESRTTKFAVLSRGKSASVFDLSEAVASRLEPRELVNLYIDNFLRNNIGGKFISGKVSEVDGVKKYSIELEYYARNKIRFAETDIFIFKGDMVYHLDGEYMTNISGLKEKVSQIIQSFKITK